MREIYIYDTSLRDGAQGNGISFSADDKKEVARRLDAFGIPYIEGGWPGSNPVDDRLFEDPPKLSAAKLSAFGSTRRPGTDASDDANLKALTASSALVCTIFGKTWDFHVTDALQTTLEENLDMISDSVRFLKDAGKEVVFDAEHFFDGYYANREYAMACLGAAVEAGADWLVLCDTNGGSLPGRISEVVEDVLLTYGTPVGIHAHNDCGLAVANSVAAVEAGATMVQGTVNGIGERCGNADLCSVMPILALKLGMDLGMDMGGLTDLSAGIAEVENVIRPNGLPFVGEDAFAHKGGMHVSALSKDTRTYEHIDPSSVGNRRRILVSDMAGRASVTEKLKELGIEESDDSKQIVDRVKSLESEGYQFEGADASFELLVRKMRNEIRPVFHLRGFRLFIDSVGDGRLTSEASIKVSDLGGKTEHTAADGNGPVDALDNAIRKALSHFFPVIDGIKLTDYKVRVLDGKAATAATVRVLITSTDGQHSWTTVGVSENVIEASLYALLDSMEYAIYKEKEGKSQ
ncbi:citramalate synthase [Methanomethylophilus alvi]|uniref:citramalate synthase n=1 Tax=Methanomethylophilus alvi TaxID=1291540 RepID=UPI0037DC4D0A